MREVLPELRRRLSNGESVAVATVVDTWQSAPRQPGATMLVAEDGTITGSVSGGCVEGALYDLCREVLVHGNPMLQRYGVSDDDALAVGLTCGGILDVFVERLSPATYPESDDLFTDIDGERPVSTATIVEHDDSSLVGRRLMLRPTNSESCCHVGTLGSDRIDSAVVDDALGLLASGRSGTLTYGPDGQRRGDGMRVFVQSFAPKPRLLVFGAIDFAGAVARMGSFLGYRVTLCDARAVFATTVRFPEADEVVVDWPHRYLASQAEAGAIDQRTAIAVLTHDPKFDVPLLSVALRLPAVGYIGVMGSRRTHEDRLARLRDEGLTHDELERMSSPIGLDLGARTPEETAVSIAAEMISLRWGGDGGRLSKRSGPIHHEQP
ncbi:XdhC family protein [Yimella sp. cx-51]|uniref:XdhC family protein n=1 Tax=Yimella sp. cx-51 TaxID=2770551 RepID=UPI00165E1528|nr:XdhC family protein [Yimella sp. cx-51]MBC9957807.1 XdhC family protein [Yimella sp. cx-51]QTH36851.1 XdhC family protein [Yimella sp. cx-51]